MINTWIMYRKIWIFGAKNNEERPKKKIECAAVQFVKCFIYRIRKRKMYCTCSLNNQWLPHHNSHQNMTTTNATANGCPEFNSSSNNCINLKYSPHHTAIPSNHTMIPWRYCSCKNSCYYCTSTHTTPSWLPHCPRQSTSQPALNTTCTNGDCKHNFQFAQQQPNTMLGPSTSPALSASPPPAPIPQPPHYRSTNNVGLCSRCRFAMPTTRHDMNDDEHHMHPGAQSINYGMGPNTYTGELKLWLFTDRIGKFMYSNGQIGFIF